MWPHGDLMVGTIFIYLAITVFGQSTELPVPYSCGKPSAEPSVLSDTRILGGEDAVAGSWPWQVRIGERVTGGVSFFCGGAIYNRQFILTAGHCFPGSSPSSPKKYVVRVGEHNMSVFESYERDYGVLQIFRHPNYTYRGAPTNDLALVRLSYPLVYTDRISPVCLPMSMNDPVPGEECVVTGWGRFLDQYSYSTNSPSTTMETTTKTRADDGSDPDDDIDPTPPPGTTSNGKNANEMQNSDAQTSISSSQDVPSSTTSIPPTPSAQTVPTSNPASSSSGRLVGAARDIITASTSTTTHVATPSAVIPTTSTTMQTTSTTTSTTASSPTTTSTSSSSSPSRAEGDNNPEETSTVTTMESTTQTSTKTPTKRTTRKQLSWNDLIKPLLEAVITSDLDEKEVFSAVTTARASRPGQSGPWHAVIPPAVIHTGHLHPSRGHRMARREAATVPPLQYASINVHSEVLKQGVVPVISRANCSAYWTSLIRDTMMCTLAPSADLEPCKGDSGGPLVCPRGNGPDRVWSIEGLISFGAGCGAKKPSVYTRVSSYVHWIERVTKSATTKPSSLNTLLSQFFSLTNSAKKGKREALGSFPVAVNDV